MSEGLATAPRWTGIDDELQEKDTGSGAIYDAPTGEFLFRVPSEYRPLIVTAVNAYDALLAVKAKHDEKAVAYNFSGCGCAYCEVLNSPKEEE